MRVLVVTNPFGDRGRGDRITDAGEIDEVLASHHAGNVVRADHDDDISATSAKPSKPSK